MDYRLFILIALIFAKRNGASQKACVFVDTWPRMLFDVNEIGCPNKNICNNTFVVSLVQSMEAYYVDENLIESMLKKCCGTCYNIAYRRNIPNVRNISSSSINSSHFVYPLLGKSDATKLYGYYFIPFLDVRDAVYVTLLESKQPVFTAVFDQLLPQIIVCLLMATTSGFLVWVIETWRNKTEFPRPFPIGWFEGFWWSIVSMTTVGYGDKSPRSVTGKLFSVIWIFIGIVSCGIITATLTNEIMISNISPEPSMEGEKVGMIKYHDFEGYMIARHDGYAVNVDGPDIETIILTLTEKLRMKEIGGFLLEKAILWHHHVRMRRKLKDENNPHRENIQFFLKHTTRTVKVYDGPKLSWGIIAKHEEHYEYFAGVIRDNQFNTERRESEVWVQQRHDNTNWEPESFYSPTNLLFSMDTFYFRYTAISLGLLIGCGCLLAGGFEIRRKNKNMPLRQDT